MSARRRPTTYAAVSAIATSVVAVGLLLSGGEDRGRELKAVVPDATGVIAGQELRLAGQRIGKIAAVRPVRRGEAVEISMEVDDSRWPLPHGTTMALRTGGTVSYENRYIAVSPARPGKGSIPEGGTIPPAHFSVPVEFDAFVGTFTAQVRRDLKAMLDNGGATLSAAARPLRRSLASAPAATEHLAGVFGDIAADRQALRTLVRSATRVVDAAEDADPGIGRLVEATGATFDELATDARDVQATLDGAPRVLAHARGTLGRADSTLRLARDVTGRLAPGVIELRRTAHPLNSVVATVSEVGPDARSALATVRRAAPDVAPLLRQATRLMPKLGSLGRQSADQLKCLRPYTPEIVGFFPAWGDMLSSGDGKDKYLRANVQAFLPEPHNASTRSSADLAKSVPGLRYGFPRPPGEIAGQPWFLPECGAGRDALDPAKDPEARSFNPLMRLPAELAPRRRGRAR